MKYLVVNADDFGMNRECNEGILYCHANGIVTSASLIANTPYSEDSAKKAIRQGLDLGVHLNLTYGKPLTKAKSLVSERGTFKADMIKRLLLGRFEKEDVQEEISAQIYFCKRHARISHIDSHKHFHVFPSLMKTIADIAADEKISWIRLPNEPLRIMLNMQTPKLLLLKRYSINAAKYYKEIGLRYADKFFGIAYTGSLTLERFKNILAYAIEGVTELMCHPGYKTGTNDALSKTREKEISILTSYEAKEAIKQNNIKLTCFGELI